jgi:hypothetical protein
VRLLQAVAVSAVVVLSAPYAGQFRAWLGETFPGRLVAIVGGVIALAIVPALVAAIVRIRSRRGLRYGAIAAALAIAAGYSLAVATPWAEVNVVERLHFVEYGVIGLSFYRAWRAFADPSIVILPLLAGSVVGSVEEWFQWFIPVRVGEAHDVAIDLVAVGSGLLFGLGVHPPVGFTWRLARTSRARVAGAAALAVLVFAWFLNAVHLGYQVSGESVSFRSHWTADKLGALARARAARWATNPPVTLRRLSAEDQYMDEALWHVRARNMADNPWVSWQENHILEVFYAPVLDAPSYVSASGHRWAPDQRRDAEARALSTNEPGVYVSHAEPYPIVVISKPAFWSAAGAMVLLLLVFAAL